MGRGLRMKRVASPTRNTVRSRLHRTRRRRGMRCYTIRMADAEIEALVHAGYLEAPIAGPAAVQMAIAIVTKA